MEVMDAPAHVCCITDNATVMSGRSKKIEYKEDGSVVFQLEECIYVVVPPVDDRETFYILEIEMDRGEKDD